MLDRPQPQSPQLCPSETFPPTHPTARARRHFSSPFLALPRAASLPVDSETFPPPRKASSPGISTIQVPPSAESLAHRMAPQPARNSPRPQPHVIPIPLAPRPLPPDEVPPSPAPDSLARPGFSRPLRQIPAGSPTSALSNTHSGHRFSA